MKPSFIFFLATLVGARGAREEKAASTTYVASLNANANFRGVSVGASEVRSPSTNLPAVTGTLLSLFDAIVTMFFPANTHAAPRVRLWNDHPDSLRAIQHVTAQSSKGEDDKSSCEASGSGCDGGFFCNSCCIRSVCFCFALLPPVYTSVNFDVRDNRRSLMRFHLVSP